MFSIFMKKRLTTHLADEVFLFCNASLTTLQMMVNVDPVGLTSLYSPQPASRSRQDAARHEVATR
jgi:hypothetical protein